MSGWKTVICREPGPIALVSEGPGSRTQVLVRRLSEEQDAARRVRSGAAAQSPADLHLEVLELSLDPAAHLPALAALEGGVPELGLELLHLLGEVLAVHD